MYKRKIFTELEEHLSHKNITVITGMRRVGKSTALKYLLDKIPHTNKVYLDLERIEHRYTFLQPTYRDVQIDLEIAGIDFSTPSVIALDEIQLVPSITSVLKYFYDTYSIKFIVTGSSSFYLKNHFSESLAGRKRIFEMYPLDFLEFLNFREVKSEVLEKFAFQPFQQGIFFHFKEFYEEYLRFGGFPEVALATSENDKKAFLKDIINAYIELDIKLLSDLEVSTTLYKLIRLLAARSGTLIDVVKLSGLTGIEKRKLSTYLDLLEKTYFVHYATPYARHVDREISRKSKIFLSDTGIMQQLAQVSSGQVFETSVYLQLMKLGEIQFYQKKSGQEIDFIMDKKTAIEAKETPHANDLTTLKNRAALLELSDTHLVGRYPPGDDFRDFVWAGCIF